MVYTDISKNVFIWKIWFSDLPQNTENSKTDKSNKFRYYFIDKLEFKNSNKNMELVKLNICYRWKNIKSAYNNNKFKISAPTLNEEFDLSDESYSVSDIQNYLKHIIKKQENVADKSHLQIYINKIKNRVVIKIKADYKLEIFSKETIRLLESTEKTIAKDKTAKMCQKLVIVSVILMHCNVVNNNYQQASKVLFTFVPDKQFEQIITIASLSLTMLKNY